MKRFDQWCIRCHIGISVHAYVSAADEAKGKSCDIPRAHLFAGQLCVAGVEAAAQEAATVDQIKAEG